ncbi:MAG: precorrin-6A/cobalt-precorrin-6A reductase [Anaerovoracaceae bacterium]|jgi:precorrin-6x reductase
MESIDQKIMAFVGSDECADLVTKLSQYTDKLYAAVSGKYGASKSPGGNITIISSFLDDAGIQRWIDRTGIKVIIDGTSPDAGASELIRRKADENGLEYLRLRKDFTLSRGIKVCASREEILSGLSYTSGKILAESADMYTFLTRNGVRKERLMIMTQPDAEEIRRLVSAGCSTEQIMCFGFDLSVDFIISIFDELDIHYYIIDKGSRNMAGKSEALNHSDVKAFLDGVPEEEDGMTDREVFDLLKERYGLK